MPLSPASEFCLETSMRELVDYECDVTTTQYVTVIHHNREQRTFVTGYEAPVSKCLQTHVFQPRPLWPHYNSVIVKLNVKLDKQDIDGWS